MAPKKDDKKSAPKKAAGSGGGKAKKKVCPRRALAAIYYWRLPCEFMAGRFDRSAAEQRPFSRRRGCSLRGSAVLPGSTPLTLLSSALVLRLAEVVQG